MVQNMLYDMASRPSTSTCQNEIVVRSVSTIPKFNTVQNHTDVPLQLLKQHNLNRISQLSSKSTKIKTLKSKNIQNSLRPCIPTLLHIATGLSFQLRLFILSLFCCFGLIAGQPVSGSRCFYFGPGMTIYGADYRRDYDATQAQCAQACRDDSCCMAFEFTEGECTLKSRSLNGTIAPKAEAFFGLCLDYEDDDRERFWDHELGGIEVAVQPDLERDACEALCHDISGSVIYTWHTSDERNIDAEIGECRCISVLQSVKLSFGSFAGFLRK